MASARCSGSPRTGVRPAVNVRTHGRSPGSRRSTADGRTLADAAAAAGLSVAEAEPLWGELARSRLPPSSATLTAEVASPVEIIRDAYGVPHVYAATERDLFL